MLLDNGIEIYLNNIDLYTADYIGLLSDPHDINDNRCFTGLIKYLSGRLKLAADVKTTTDLAFMAAMWDQYTGLCYRYKQSPTEAEFCLFLGITPALWQDMKTGRYRRNDRLYPDGAAYEGSMPEAGKMNNNVNENINVNTENNVNIYNNNTMYSNMAGSGPILGGAGLNLTRPEFIQTIAAECALGRYKLAERGSVGGIFLSKAIDGLNDQPQQQQQPQRAAVDLESIAELLRPALSDKKPGKNE